MDMVNLSPAPLTPRSSCGVNVMSLEIWSSVRMRFLICQRQSSQSAKVAPGNNLMTRCSSGDKGILGPLEAGAVSSLITVVP